MRPVRTHYDNLKVARNAPLEVIRAAYKTLSQKYHPDKTDAPDAAKIMRVINKAYEVLSDPESRKAHDLWIASQEQPKSYDKPTNKQAEENKSRDYSFSLPESGECSIYDLDENAQRALIYRVSGFGGDQVLIKTGGIFWILVWICGLIFWLYYTFTDGMETRWEGDSLALMLGLTSVAGLALSSLIDWINSWFKTPLKKYLIATPLYIISTKFDRVAFWPLSSITDIKATHNYKNGIYQDTSLQIFFDGKRKDFDISPQSAYDKLWSHIKIHSARLHEAYSTGDIEYIRSNDEFWRFTKSSKHVSSPRTRLKSPVFWGCIIISLTALYAAYDMNLGRPIKPAHIVKQQNNKKPERKPPYVRPDTAPNGSPWPAFPGYINGFKILMNKGLSTITVDNSQNDSDVFVKLIYLEGADPLPTRVFFIPAFSSYTLKNVSIGRYDIRYRDLDTGNLSRTDPFNIKEVPTSTGTQYDSLTMTLYKVHNGNMQTYGIDESEF